MLINAGKYKMMFQNGGVEILKDGDVLYFNRRPVYAFLKTALSITEFYDAPYEEVSMSDEKVTAKGVLKSPTGSALAFSDTYEAAGSGFKVSRMVTVLENTDDLGFATKISFVMAASDDVRAYDYFAPANWYRQNEFAKPHVMGFDMDCEYFWRREVNYTLPMFSAQSKSSGETVTLSRWAADVTMRDHNFVLDN